MERIKTPFGFSSTADEVVDGVDLSGKYAIVTGGSSGIGIDTARVLASTGASVVLAVRRSEAGDTVVRDVSRSLPAIAKYFSQVGDVNAKIGLLDDGMGPGALHQLPTADDLACTLDQGNENVEGAAAQHDTLTPPEECSFCGN